MWTINYRGFFINGYCHKDECSVVDAHGHQFGAFKNVRAAKLYITGRCDWSRCPTA